MSQSIVELKNISLSFNTTIYRPWTVRDLVVQVVNDPFSKFAKTDDRVAILDDISLTISKGDRIGIIGVNGAGKTTLCRVIAGFYSPQKGSVTVHGKIRSIFDTGIGIQSELTGRENAVLLLKLMYPELRERHEEMLADICEFTELGSYLDVPFRLYSNGMQARLCLSIVSSRPSDLLILDEVFDGADQFFKEKIAKRTSDIIAKSGAVLFVSHSDSQIKEVCNRVLYLKDGKIVFDGDPVEGLKLYSKLGNPAQ